MDGPPVTAADCDPVGPFYLGLPFWGHKGWAGSFYRAKTKPADHLSQYAQVFNTVEGNTTFYSLPSEATVERWAAAVSDDFRFLFKLPRWISHELRLEAADEACADFFTRLAPLAPRIGILLIQLPPSFGPNRLGVLDRFLSRLPAFYDQLGRSVPFAVEPRHGDFYDPSPASFRLDDLLRRHGVERCWMDTRALRDGDPTPPAVIEACRKKPDVPTRIPALECALGPRPVIRFVAHPDASTTQPWLRRWTRVLAHWLRQGRTPYFMVHLPDNQLVPELAAEAHRLLSERVPLTPLSPFPASVAPPEPGGQLSLL